MMFSCQVWGCNDVDRSIEIKNNMMRDQIKQYLSDRQGTYYLHSFFEKQIDDLIQRAMLLPAIQRDYHISSYELAIIEDRGSIILVSEGNLYCFFFSPLHFFLGYDVESSRELLTIKRWTLPQDLTNAVTEFKKTRDQIIAEEDNGIFNEEQWAIQKISRSNSRHYRYLLFLWPQKTGYHFLFECDPCDDGMQGKPYYQHLMGMIWKIIMPWRKKYLLEHNLLPASERKYLEGCGYLA